MTKIAANGGATTTIIGGLTSPAGLSIDSAGDVFVADSGAGDVVELPVSGTQSVILTGLTAPTFITVNPAGTLLFITEPTIGTVVEASLTQSTARVVLVVRWALSHYRTAGARYRRHRASASSLSSRGLPTRDSMGRTMMATATWLTIRAARRAKC